LSDIVDIKRGLAARAQSVAEMLLPNGEREGHEWRVGSLGGEKGKSLGVHLVGEKAGIWSDFSTGETGDLIDLWVETRGIKLVEALDAARDYLGIKRPQEVRHPKVQRRQYKLPPKPKCNLPKAKALDYLREVRNISAEAIAAYKIAEQGDKIIFPFLSRDGETLILAKAREARSSKGPGDKVPGIPTAKECAPTLMGWHLVPHNAREINITEGEIDALSLYDYGRTGLSVPFGGGKGGKQDWIETDFDMLQAMERINLVLDDDEVGDQAAEDIASRLGRHRCFRVRLPKKDANECLVAGVAKEEIDRAFAEAKTLDPEELMQAIDFASDVVDLFWPKPGTHIGYHMPYEMVRDKLHFRPGEMTLWGGPSGDGKSQILSDCHTDWVAQGARCCVLSLEMTGKYTLKRMVKQASNVDRPTEEFIIKTLRWLSPGTWVYNLTGKVNIDSVLEVFDYARCRYGCDMFIIDSLMRLGVASDDYVAQEQLAFKLVEWAKEKNVHVHLVAHARKGDMSRGVPNLEDFKGASEIGANAHNAIMVWRNRKHEEEIAEAIAQGDEDALKDLRAKPGVAINVCKQRNGDWEGKCGLWFEMATYRYRSSEAPQFGRNYLNEIEGKKVVDTASLQSSEAAKANIELVDDIF
jgi:twinkle protein